MPVGPPPGSPARSRGLRTPAGESSPPCSVGRPRHRDPASSRRLIAASFSRRWAGHIAVDRWNTPATLPFNASYTASAAFLVFTTHNACGRPFLSTIRSATCDQSNASPAFGHATETRLSRANRSSESPDVPKETSRPSDGWSNAGWVAVESTTVDPRSRPVAEHPAGRRDEPGGEGLALVEEDHAPGDVVELPAPPGLVREEALEEHDIRGHDDRGVPVLGPPGGGVQPGLVVVRRRRRPPARRGCSGRTRRGRRRRPQGLADRIGVLVEDAQVRGDIDDPPEAVPRRVLEGEGEPCEGLAAAGRDGQRVQPRRPLGRIQAGPENRIAGLGDLGARASASGPRAASAFPAIARRTAAILATGSSGGGLGSGSQPRQRSLVLGRVGPVGVDQASEEDARRAVRGGADRFGPGARRWPRSVPGSRPRRPPRWRGPRPCRPYRRSPPSARPGRADRRDGRRPRRRPAKASRLRPSPPRPAYDACHGPRRGRRSDNFETPDDISRGHGGGPPRRRRRRARPPARRGRRGAGLREPRYRPQVITEEAASPIAAKGSQGPCA